MVKEIVKDITILTKISRNFDVKTDSQIVVDLLDTAKAHSENCAGLAAIQIGADVRCFVVAFSPEIYGTVINPLILKRSPEVYKTVERCLSLEGEREVKRHKWIDVIYQNSQGKYIKTQLSGYPAQVFQHEYDHLSGKLI